MKTARCAPPNGGLPQAPRPVGIAIEYDYVVVPLTDGALRIADAAGESVVELKQGVAYFRKAGVEHNVTNAGDRYLAFVDIELVEHPG